MSEKQYSKSLFIFRRDLRVNDNTALLEALQNSEKVLTCFIIDPDQIDTKKNKYKSEHCLQFMTESLEDLAKQLKQHKGNLFLFHGAPAGIIKKIHNHYKFEALYTNQDYTPFSIKRDKALKAACKKLQANFHQFQDYTLQPVGEILTKQKTPYKVFGSFFTTAKKISIPTPQENKFTNYAKRYTGKDNVTTSVLKKHYKSNKKILLYGGRKEALKLAKQATDLTDYKSNRDFLDYTTSYLSAYNKFGCISIRELYHNLTMTLNKSHELIRQLFWRDFFYHLSFYFPEMYKLSAMQKKFQKIQWRKSKKDFEIWQQGLTGFPLVDACMRMLNTTGFMPGRGRMVVASFLTKDLHISWRWGEQYFAQKLVDYDPAINNGNWQWVASTGIDASPYFRVFNPWEQSKKYDPKATFIKMWIPELKNVPAKHIHRWQQYHEEYNTTYPAPIVNHKQEAQHAISIYKKC